MNKAQQKHLKKLQNEFVDRLSKKYKCGAREHGGNIWDNPKLLDEALEEIIDLYVYVATQRDELIKWRELAKISNKNA